MQPQRWQDKQISLGDLVRLSFFIIVILLILGLGVIYILNVLIAPNPSVGSASIFSAIFIVLGVLFAFIQIVVAFRKASQTSLPSIPNPPLASFIDKDKAALATFQKEVENDLQYKSGTGAIIIVTIEQMLNKQIIVINYWTQTIEMEVPVVTRTYNGHTIYVAKALRAPGVYNLTCPTASRVPIRTVQMADIAEGQVTQLDWRR